MAMHKVEVDDEVFAFVQRRAVALEDTFNSALRRELPLEGRAPPAGASGSSFGGGAYQPPPGMSQALGQILGVVQRVLHGCDRKAATRKVAESLGITYQTVESKYTTQLGRITAAQFDRLTANRDGLRKLLHSKFPDERSAIDQVLSEQEHPLDLADRFFGRQGGAELAIPDRGSAPGRLPPKFGPAENEQ